jgi:LacI family transcriptional regulator
VETAGPSPLPVHEHNGNGNGNGRVTAGGPLLLPTSSTYWFHRSIEWLSTLPRPIGILACCDLWGQQILGDCAMAGIDVPEDVAVVGVDDDELVCSITQPPLSSVHVPWERVGGEVAALVQRLLDGEPPPPRAVEVAAGDVSTRRSSDVIAVDDPDVAAALAFIRSSANRPIGVPDILRVVPTYRERLQRAFRRTLGRTVMQEVHRIHVERAKHLLASTDWPTDRVAEHCGLENAVKLAVVFRKFAGQTPSAYRRQLRARGEAC